MTSESNSAEKSSVTARPLVSVAIIAYNQKEFLRECLDSILAQDYDNIEIVVADDCSTDGTQEFLRAYQVESPRKLVLRLAESNQGITLNSNAAHFACTGKYIAWIGGDDLMLPGKISAQVDIMEASPVVALCYHDLDVFDSDSDASLGLMSQVSRPRTGRFRDVVAFGTFNGACATMVRGSATPPDGFDERLPIASDWKFWMDSLTSGGEVYYIDRVLGRYRRHGKNITGNAKTVPLANHQDHLAAASYVMSEHPDVAAQLLRRQADIMRGLRNYEGGGRYMTYMWASLKVRLTAKSLVGLILGLFGRKY